MFPHFGEFNRAHAAYIVYREVGPGEMHPLFNQKLRHNRQLCALRMTGEQPEVVYSKDIHFATDQMAMRWAKIALAYL